MSELQENLPSDDVVRVDELLDTAFLYDPQGALTQLDDLTIRLQSADEPQALFTAYFGQSTYRVRDPKTLDEALAAAVEMSSLAIAHHEQIWLATACATQALVHVHMGEVLAAFADLSSIDMAVLEPHLKGRTGFRLMDTLANVYSQLRFFDRAELIRQQLTATIDTQHPCDQARHWLNWSIDLAARSVEPLARGCGEPDHHLMDRALVTAGQVTTDSVDIPSRWQLVLDTIQALSSAYRGRPSHSITLLGAGVDPYMPSLVRQLRTLTSVHAHSLVGSVSLARAMDEETGRTYLTFPQLIIEVAQARERLWIESSSGGQVDDQWNRLSELVTKLCWQAMNLASHVAHPALDLHAARAESRTDALTMVGNRRAFDEDLNAMLRHGELPLSLVVIDVDNFKSINDQYSHAMGDEVLKAVASCLEQHVRPIDRLARYGGDEFVLLLARTDETGGQAVAATVQKAVASIPWRTLHSQLSVEISAGCASLSTITHRHPSQDAQALFQRADDQLLASKAQRRSAHHAQVPGPPHTPRGLPLADFHSA